MTYRERAAALMLNAARELGLHISETDIARAAGFDKKSMITNANEIAALLREKNDNMRLSISARPTRENRRKIESEQAP